MDTHCRYCGSVIPNGVKRCLNCGRALDELATENFDVYTPEVIKVDMRVFEAYASFWSNSFDFDGRARRKEYWCSSIINYVISVILFVFSVYFEIDIIALFFLIFEAALLIPSVSVMVRRLHDLGKSILYLLFLLIPYIGIVILNIMFLLDGDSGNNFYGESQKYLEIF